MKKELYYCNYWEHMYYTDYELCVSDIIYSKDKKLAQIHMIVMKEGKVVRGMSATALKALECNIRELIRNIYGANKMFENETVKICF